MSKKLIITVGPATINNSFLDEINNDNYIFRINAAHVPVNNLREFIQRVKSNKVNRKILVDVPSNKMRLKNIQNTITLETNDKLILTQNNFNFEIDYNKLKIGSPILTNDGKTKLIISKIDCLGKKIELYATEKSKISVGKGVHFVGKNVCYEKKILNEKDLEIIKICTDNEIDFIGISYIREINEILYVEEKIKDTSLEAFYKIETKDALNNLDDILGYINWAILDRGDLSSEIGILNLFSAVNRIIDSCEKNNIKLFIATQILSSLKTSNIPSISDIMDLQRLFTKNVFGFQFSDETAIGNNPFNCIKWFEDIQKSHNIHE